MRIDEMKTSKSDVTVGFEGHWHSIKFQPDLSVPQEFVIGAALSRKGKVVAYRIATEAPRLKCFYMDRFSKTVWKFLHDEVADEFELALGSASSNFRSSSPQISLSAGSYASGISQDSVLSRTFERIVTVTAHEKKLRASGVTQAELRTSISRILKIGMSSRYEQISLGENGLRIKDGDRFRSFDITYDNNKVASSIVSASYANIEASSLNVYKAIHDLTMFKAIRTREQLGIAVLMPSTAYFPKATVDVWSEWWAEESYKLRESKAVLIAESDQVEALADQVMDWYSI
jgi:hypothetical protein